MKKKVLSLILTVCMLLSLVPVETMAVSGEAEGPPCPHHTEHTDQCGYADPVQAVPCGHICDETCYRTETICLHIEHDETCGGIEDAALCNHLCSEESGCVTRSQNCQHLHDETCGYAEGSQGEPCTFQCQECAASEESAETATDSNAETEWQEDTQTDPDAETGGTEESTETATDSNAETNGTEETVTGSDAAADESADVVLQNDLPLPAAETSNMAYLFAEVYWPAEQYDYAVWAWPDGGSGHWVYPAGSADENGWIAFDVGDAPNVIFAAINKGAVVDWGNKAYQTGDLKYDSAKPYYTLTSTTGGDWSDSGCQHSWTEETVTEASCTQEGLLRFTCSLCGKTYDRTVPMLPHSPNAEGVCSVCGKPPVRVFLAWEHILDSSQYDLYIWVVDGPANMYFVAEDGSSALSGYSSFTLTGDGERFCFLLIPKGEDPNDHPNGYIESWNISYPTENAYFTGKLYTVGSPSMEVTQHTECSHSWTETVNTPVTCTQQGKLEKTCAQCGFVSTLTTVAPGHSKQPEELTVVTPPTCTVEGSGTYICQICQETVSVAIPATNHNFQFVETITAATCTEEGSERHACVYEGCTETKNVTIPALGHDFDENLICKRCSQEATILLTADGEIVYYIKMYDALRDANGRADGANIQLLKDTTWKGRLDGEWQTVLSNAPGPIVLDLGGHTLTCDFSSSPSYVFSDSEVTVKNGGVQITGSGSYVFYLSGGRFIMEDITFSGRASNNVINPNGSTVSLTRVALAEGFQCTTFLYMQGGTVELTDCTISNDIETEHNKLVVYGDAQLTLHSGRYHWIYDGRANGSITSFLDTDCCYRYTSGDYATADAGAGKEIYDVDVVPLPFTPKLPAELSVIGRQPVTIVPEYTANATDFDPSALTFQWTYSGQTPEKEVVSQDGSVTLTYGNQTGMGEITCTYSYMGYTTAVTIPVTTEVCTEHTYDSDGLCVSCKAYQPATDSDGDGYYEIDNAGKLWWFSQQVNDGNNELNAVLTANIDLSTTCGEELGNWLPISYQYGYSGHFNGQGHTVSGLYIASTERYVGLFGRTQEATIENLTVTGNVRCSLTYIEKKSTAAGGIVAYAWGGTIRNCHVNMTVSGEGNVGGICAVLDSVTIGGCTSRGTVECLGTDEAGAAIGGIVGLSSDSSTVRGCINEANVTGKAVCNLAGIVCANNGTVENCTNLGSIGGDQSSYTGGIVASSYGTVKNCANRGAISGGMTGGIAGGNNGVIENCYHAGTISGRMHAEPIVGYPMTDSTVTNCYYLSDTTTEDGGRTADQFASGQVAYELNGSSTTDTSVWRQNLGEDNYPTLSGSLVYYGETLQCDGTSTGIFYHNTQPDTTVPPHEPDRETGLCAVCQTRIGYLRVTVGETDQYAMTLPEAASLAGTQTATITLLDNLGTTETSAAALGSITCGDLTLELNGKDISYSGYPFVTASSGKLTITGTGTFRQVSNGSILSTSLKGNVKLRGGTYQNGLSSDRAAKDLLADGYMLKGSSWIDTSNMGSSLNMGITVSVLPAPIRITKQPGNVSITQGDPVSLTIEAAALEPDKAITYEWFDPYETTKVYGNEAALDLSTLAAGTYWLRCKVTCDGVSVTSDRVTVTVTVTKVLSVDITWGDLSFVYSKGTWDPVTHTYSGEGWMPENTDGNCISLANSGDLETSVSIRYDPAQGYETITGTLSEGAAILPAGGEKKFYLTLAGKPEAEMTDATIGTITLTIGGE